MDASAESNEDGGEPAGKGGERTARSRRSDSAARSRARDEKQRGISRKRPDPARRDERRPGGPGPARLYALLAGAFLAMLGVLGFFYDATFGTGESLTSDDLAGILIVNGWRNVIYIVTGVLGLAFASRWPRRTAFGLGLLYLVFAIWGFDQTERGIGDLLDAVPLGDNDNALHLILGVLGLGAALVDGPLPNLPERLKPKRREQPKRVKARSKPGSGEERGRARRPGAKPGGEPEAKPKSKPEAKPKSGAAETEKPTKKRDLPRPRPAGSPRPSSSS